MNRTWRLLVPAVVMMFATVPISAHERHTDPDLAELNDYLTAIQVLRFRDETAAELFALWRTVREASWAIREATDRESLPIEDPVVQQKIAEARRLRSRLRDRSRRFFAGLEATLPTIHFRIGREVEAVWADEILESRVGSRDIVLVKVLNESGRPVHAELNGERSDRILFWNKTMLLEPSDFRYTFALLAFSEPGSAVSAVTVRVGEETARVRIRAAGIPLPRRDPPLLLPGSTYSVRLPVEADRSGNRTDPFLSPFLQFRVRDARTEEPLPVRVEVVDEENRFHWSPLRGPSYAVTREGVGWRTPLWEFQPGPYFYIDGYGELGVEPEGKRARFYHGFEYLPAEVSVPEDGVVDIRMERWIDMRERGWYPGQTHIHTTDAGIPVPLSEFWPLVSRAEDLAVSYILTLKGEWETHAVYSDEYPMGPVRSKGTNRHIIAYGQEYRNNPYGHLALLGLDELIEPISSGALGELAGPDYPPNAIVLDAALAMGATAVGAHFGGYILEGRPVQSRWPSTGFEMPVDVALRRLHVAEVYGNAGQREVWYKLLNCGFEIAATAGPDWEIKDTPRTYVFLGSREFNLENWTAGLRRGESFITHGPMLWFQVEDARPGARLHFSEPSRTVRVEAAALTPSGSIPVEIVINGEVVAQGRDLSRDIVLNGSAWLAARAEGAHSNPVYVTLQGRPRGDAADARDFIAVTDRLIEWVARKGLFDTPGQKESVLNLLREGRAVFEAIVDRSGSPD